MCFRVGVLRERHFLRITLVTVVFTEKKSDRSGEVRLPLKNRLSRSCRTVGLEIFRIFVINFRTVFLYSFRTCVGNFRIIAVSKNLTAGIAAGRILPFVAFEKGELCILEISDTC